MPNFLGGGNLEGVVPGPTLALKFTAVAEGMVLRLAGMFVIVRWELFGGNGCLKLGGGIWLSWPALEPGLELLVRDGGRIGLSGLKKLDRRLADDGDGESPMRPPSRTSSSRPGSSAGHD